MKARVPLVPTLLVLLAVATMLGLGVWQLQRRAWKDGLVARYAAAATRRDEVAWPTTPDEVTARLYRRSWVDCAGVRDSGAISGRSLSGEPGLARTVTCELKGGGEASVVLGWTHAPAAPDWRGGVVNGTIGPGAGHSARLIADPPVAGLGANARPDPRDLPNNHLAYAVQWFLFAATALVIYALALRKRGRPSA